MHKVHVTAVPAGHHHLVSCTPCGPVGVVADNEPDYAHPVERFCATHIKEHGVTVPDEYLEYLDG